MYVQWFDIFLAEASRCSGRSSVASDACSSGGDGTLLSHKALNDLEAQASVLGRSVDTMLSDLQTNLHTVSRYFIVLQDKLRCHHNKLSKLIGIHGSDIADNLSF